MKRWLAGWRLRSRNTIARWIALTTIVAMLTALAFNALFTQLAGVWAYPPLSEIGLLEKISLTTKLIEASQAPQRERLAAAATDSIGDLGQIQAFAAGMPTDIRSAVGDGCSQTFTLRGL